MFELNTIEKQETGIVAVDKAINIVRNIVNDMGSKSFELARYLFTLSVSQSFKLQLSKLTASDGKPYETVTAWICETFGMQKSAACDLVKIGEHTARIDNGKPHGMGYASRFAYTALRDSKAKCRYDVETGALLETVYSDFDFDALDFGISACGVLAHCKYEDVVSWIRQGLIRPTMTVRELKEACKALKKGVSIEDSKPEDSKPEDSKPEGSKPEDSKPEMVTFAVDGVAYSIPKEVLEKYRLK